MRVKKPDLPVVLDRSLCPREAGDDICSVVAPPAALQLVSSSDLVVAELVAGGRGARVSVRDLHPAHRVAGVNLGSPGKIIDVRARAVGTAHGGVRARRRGQRAQCSRPVRPQLRRRLPTVEQPIGASGVLGEINIPAGGVDGHRLVGESPERLDRL